MVCTAAEMLSSDGAGSVSGHISRTNLKVKVLDFVQFGGPMLTVGGAMLTTGRHLQS